MKYSNSDIRALTTLEAGVLIPGLQAGIIGLMIGIVGGTIAMLAGGDLWKWGLLSGAISSLLAFWAGVSAWRDAIYSTTQPEPVQVYQSQAELKLSIDWDEGRAGLFDELGITDAQFIAWACGAARGQSLGENHWTGSRNPFSKGQYHAMLDRLLFHNVIKKAGKARNSGYTLSSKGRAVCSAILGRYGDLPSPVRQNYLPGGDYRL